MEEMNPIKERIEYLSGMEEGPLKAYKALLYIQVQQVEAWFGDTKKEKLEAKGHNEHLFSECYCVERALKKKGL